MDRNTKYLFFLVFALLATAFLNCNNHTLKNEPKYEPASIKVFNTPPGTDSTVPPELGGAGFNGEGWHSNENYNCIGDTNAVKGGRLVISLNDFPVTLRPIGQNSNTYFRKIIGRLIYESLLDLDPITQDYTPRLATHWKISDDNREFMFRINPEARWADGKPVTTDDVIATWELYKNSEILDPFLNSLALKYERPIAKSKYIVSVKSKEVNFQQFYIFAYSFGILPAHYIKDISGKDYLEKYQFKFIPGSGPYIVNEADIIKGQEISLRRCSDYWADNMKFNKGLNNFNLIKINIIHDPTLELEKFKNGEIDILEIRNSSVWNDKLNFDDIKRGLMIKRRVFNEAPGSLQGIVFNTRKAPFDDIRIRKAFIYLFDREKFNQKLYFNSNSLINSFFPGSVYANPNNPVLKFNIDSASALLKEAGWVNKNSNGYLEKNGKEFDIELPFQEGTDKYLTIYQEDLKKAGIRLSLKKIDLPTLIKLGNERAFNMLPVAWMTPLIPNPESYMSSESADQIGTANWDGLKDKKIDELIRKYAVAFDKNERVKIIREIDYIATNHFNYIFRWYPNYQRIVFQNKFGYPNCMLERYESFWSILNYWYINPEKKINYEEALQNKNKFLDTEDIDNKYWLYVKEKE